ncbi:uncharacterized protein LOC135462503 [Liolophura sinensis]|uniref:uncharacterized protein LOC135462503 n=1 Tax=Liolophura sinensis TaxID=3198878 RepID=UPI003158F592
MSSGEGVTECGDKLCGYRAECNTDRSDCRCPFNNAEPRELKGTSPSLWYCVEKCDLKGSVCPDNTTCRDSSGNDRHLCECSEKATLSSTGQCLALSSKSTASVGPATTTTAGPNENRNVQSDCNALTVGLAVGFGEPLWIMVIVVVVVLIRKHWGLKVVELCKSQGSVLQNMNSNDNLSAAETEHSYENIESSSSLEESRRSRRTGPRTEIQMDINETDAQPIGDSPAYEDVSAPSQSPNDNDNSGLYESINSRDTSGTRLYTSLVENKRLNKSERGDTLVGPGYIYHCTENVAFTMQL